MEKVLETLRSIEERKKIRILYACETGSRAWGFPSPDSDYDVRFIYMHERDWYLSLSQRKDTIEHMDGDWDITGWDLRKCLLMLKKSNAPLIERFQSPIVYYADKGFEMDFKKLIGSYYSPIAVFYHHYSLANKFWDDVKDKNEVKLKSCFYLLRSLLSCNWIVSNKSIVPMHTEGLMTLLKEDQKSGLRMLIRLKSEVGESFMYTMEDWLNTCISDLWKFIESNRSNLGVNNSDYSTLDKFFVKAIYDHDDTRGYKR